MIDLDKHGEAYLIGDVHGDPFAFYRALILTECVDVTFEGLSNSAKCHHRSRTSLEVEGQQAASGQALPSWSSLGTSWTTTGTRWKKREVLPRGEPVRDP